MKKKELYEVNATRLHTHTHKKKKKKNFKIPIFCKNLQIFIVYFVDVDV